MPTFVIKTPRMILRPWRDEDYAPYAALNADPEVRRSWAGALSMEESDAEAAGLQRRHRQVNESGVGKRRKADHADFP
jgi:RimJ/RimL family protein N-acetyltransferase